jgi:cell division protein ZapA
MPEIQVSVGGRDYEVACQEGEETFLRSAAAMLDAEAAVLGAQAQRLPESRVLLMAGLMLADKTAGMDDQVRALEVRLAECEVELEEARAMAAQAQRVEVPVVPDAVLDMLASLATRAEALADATEERLAG